MKHFIYLFTLACIWLSLGLAQTDQASHDVSVTIPIDYGIRLIRNAGTFPEPYTVTFNYGTDLAAYQAAVTSGDPLIPTYTNVSDVTVRANGDGSEWCVFVSATAFPAASGLSVSDISVTRDKGPVSGLQAPGWLFSPKNKGRQIKTWVMSTTDVEVGCSQANTPSSKKSGDGWVSLGFNGLDYELTVDGDEEPGTYTSVITYTIVYP